jgi:arylsulfatase A-like enzyme
VVVSFDRLHVGYLGCYGNDWIETPNLDRLATEAVIFDAHFSENLDSAAVNHAWWTGRCQFPLDAQAQRDCRQFADDLRSAQIRTWLLVESDGREETMVAPSFDDVRTIRGTDSLEASESETPFARVVQHACDWLDESAGRQVPELLWIKSRGVPSPWLPPRDFADLYLDEFGLAAEEDLESDEDSEASESAEEDAQPQPDEGPPQMPPTRGVPQADESLDWRYAAAMYAGYVTLVDRWFGKLAARLARSPEWADALLIVCAGSGQALGEHARVEADEPLLRAECVQVPLWVRLPGSDQCATRRKSLVQTIDVAPTLTEWFELAHSGSVACESDNRLLAGKSLLPLIRSERPAIRDAALMGIGRREWGIRTADFFYVEPGNRESATDTPALLFEKPQDRWDQCDVLSQYSEIADELRDRLRQVMQGRRLGSLKRDGG